MSWYVHTTKQLRDDELPPELVVTNRNGSIEQVYVPYNASEQLKAENAKLREERDHWHVEQVHAYGNWEDAHKRVIELEKQNAELREQLAKARDPQRIGGTADPESFVYAIEQLREFRWQHATNDEDAIPYINNVAAAHERENAELREELGRVRPTDSEGEPLDIADTVHMLRSEYDGDHEWDDVVTELAISNWGGGRWIVRGAKGEAWACNCTRTGSDYDAYEDSDDVQPFDNATLPEVENAKLREEIQCWEQLTANIELPEYPVTEFVPKDIERENAKLRDLVADVWHLVKPSPGCRYTAVLERIEELGIEVGG